MARYRCVYDKGGRLVGVYHSLATFCSPDAEKTLDIREEELKPDAALRKRQLSIEFGGDGLTKDAADVLSDQLQDPEFRAGFLRAASLDKLDVVPEVKRV